MNKKIELTQQELDEIKSQAADEGSRWQKVLGFIKQCDKVGFPLNYSSVKTQQRFQWFFIGGLYTVIIGVCAWIIRMKLQGG